MLIAGVKTFPTNGAPPAGTTQVPPVPGFPLIASNKLAVEDEQTVTGVSCGALPKPE